MNERPINPEKKRKIAALLALLGALQPTPVPFAGIHKFYLGQYGWGLLYVALGVTQVPRIACAAESLWYLVGRWEALGDRIWGAVPNTAATVAPSVGDTVDAVASSLREIEQLRREGLLSEYEFEQKRRSLLEKMP